MAPLRRDRRLLTWSRDSSSGSLPGFAAVWNTVRPTSPSCIPARAPSSGMLKVGSWAGWAKLHPLVAAGLRSARTGRGGRALSGCSAGCLRRAGDVPRSPRLSAGGARSGPGRRRGHPRGGSRGRNCARPAAICSKMWRCSTCTRGLRSPPARRAWRYASASGQRTALSAKPKWGRYANGCSPRSPAPWAPSFAPDAPAASRRLSETDRRSGSEVKPAGLRHCRPDSAIPHALPPVCLVCFLQGHVYSCNQIRRSETRRYAK